MADSNLLNGPLGVLRDKRFRVSCCPLKPRQIGQISNIAQCDTDIAQKATPLDPFDRRFSKKHTEILIAQPEIMAKRDVYG